MKSEIFEKIGIDSLDPAYYIIALFGLCIILLLFLIVMAFKVKNVKKKYKRFLKGSTGENLESIIYNRFEEIDRLKEDGEEKSKKMQLTTDNLKLAFQKSGIIKYDAFNEMGGKLSFSLALLDAENTGFVINAMHSREGCYTYIKEIIKGESAISLGEEEQKALDKAMENKGN